MIAGNAEALGDRPQERVTRAAILALMLVTGCGSSTGDAAPPTPIDRGVPIEAHHALAALPDAWVFRVPLDGAAISIVDASGRSLEAVRLDEEASVVINGGFFDPAFAPEGLSVSGGRVLSAHLPALSGGVLTIEGARAHLHEAERYDAGAIVDFAVQCRPRLVVDGARNIATDDGRRAARTALCVRDDRRTLDVVIVPAPPELGVTLFQLADALVDHGCLEALNLDGGPSTGAAWRAPDGTALVPPRGPVRQAIVVGLRRPPADAR